MAFDAEPTVAGCSHAPTCVEGLAQRLYSHVRDLPHSREQNKNFRWTLSSFRSYDAGMSQPQLQPVDDLEVDVDAAIESCGGDLRATVRALLVANTFLAGEVEALMSATSTGYSRGRVKQGAKSKPESPSKE
jgi:hypothetical protein